MLPSLIISLLVAVAVAAPIPLEKRTSLNDLLLLISDYFPALDITVTAAATLTTVAENALAVLTGTDTTEDGLSGACKDLTVIYARGTSDPGNVGFLTGPWWYQAIEDLVGSDAVAFQGVTPYTATVDGFLQGGDAIGSASMAKQVQQAFTQCPSTKVIMGGYSQGGQLVHNAAALLPAATMAKVSGVVIFGDPDNGTAVTGISASKVLIVCHDGDNICEGGDLILLPHLTYASDAATAAAFAVKAAGLS